MAKFYIDQHGCAKNQTDGEILAGFLIQAGFTYTPQPQEADFILINSCGFIASAKKESIDAVYALRTAYPKSKIVLAGCLAERYASELYEAMPELDGIFGNGDLSKITDYMKSFNTRKAPALYPQKGVCCGYRPILFNFKASAYVKITEGCSNKCSFCAIPLIRGEVRSRPVKNILEEIKSLTAQGVYEINLIGQDLAVFTTDEEAASSFSSGLAYLLSKIDELEGDFIVRTLYIHPDHFDLGILKYYKNSRRFVPYFDLPFQSGDDTVIKAMNRIGPVEKYVELIASIRRELPSAVIRTTFLTGFPGETEESAANTQNFLARIKPDWSGCFAYSREENTPAWSMKPRVPAKVAEKRAQALTQAQTELTSQHLQRYISKEILVLVEEVVSSQEEGLAIARAWFQSPEVDGAVVVRFDPDEESQLQAMKEGNLVKVKVLAVTGVDLDASFISLEKVFPALQKINYLYN